MTPPPKDPAKIEEYCRKQSENQKKLWEIPNYRAKLCVSLKKIMSTPDVRKKMSNSQQKRCDRPGDSERRSAAAKKGVTLETRRKLGIVSKIRLDNPIIKEQMINRTKELMKDPEYKIKWAISHSASLSSTESRERMSNSAKRRYELSGNFWYGSVKYYDGPRYCEKWTTALRERVRAFFGYCCFECGTPQKGKKLHVHHVWYNKKLCCDDTPRSLIPLCQSCHMKTNHNRQYWSEHFQNILDNYYEGRCWLTKEEYATLSPVFILPNLFIDSSLSSYC